MTRTARACRGFPGLRPRTPSAGRRANWAGGFTAEAWYWGFAVAVATFAATLSVKLFFVILTASIATRWIVTSRVKD